MLICLSLLGTVIQEEEEGSSCNLVQEKYNFMNVSLEFKTCNNFGAEILLL
jgi:hypothetical protein